jgi:hypothetical protein
MAPLLWPCPIAAIRGKAFVAEILAVAKSQGKGTVA